MSRYPLVTENRRSALIYRRYRTVVLNKLKRFLVMTKKSVLRIDESDVIPVDLSIKRSRVHSS